MNRCLAMLFAVLCASLSVASACTAAPSDWISFTLKPARSNGDIQASFRDEERDRDNNHWSTNLPPQQLTGLEVAGFRAAGTRPLRFALVREAGRLDCAGQGGNNRATGNCRFTADAAFNDLLATRGIGRPNRRQAFGLVALDVRRDLIDAIAGARYPTPDLDQLMSLTAVGVTRAYVAELARLGYRPASIDNLVEFRALGITPEYIGAFSRAGYTNLDPDDLVQLKALGVTPEYVAGFGRLGYRQLPVSSLVQLKALNITPEFVRSLETRSGEAPPVADLIERKIFGRSR